MTKWLPCCHIVNTHMTKWLPCCHIVNTPMTKWPPFQSMKGTPKSKALPCGLWSENMSIILILGRHISLNYPENYKSHHGKFKSGFRIAGKKRKPYHQLSSSHRRMTSIYYLHLWTQNLQVKEQLICYLRLNKVLRPRKYGHDLNRDHLCILTHLKDLHQWLQIAPSSNSQWLPIAPSSNFQWLPIAPSSNSQWLQIAQLPRDQRPLPMSLHIEH